jgi:hypothetical protein
MTARGRLRPSSLNVSGLTVDGRSSTRSGHSRCSKADLQRMNPISIELTVRHLSGASIETRYSIIESPFLPEATAMAGS